MVKGTRFLILILLLTLSVPVIAAERVTLDATTRRIMDLCEELNGTSSTQAIAGEPEEGRRIEVTNRGDTRVETWQKCEMRLCYINTADVESVDFNDIRSFNIEMENVGSTSASGAVARGRACTTTVREIRETVRRDDDDRGDGDRDGRDGSVSGNGGVSIEIDGNIFTCNTTSDPEECLRIKNRSLGGWVLVRGGLDGSGRRIYIARRGGSGDTDGRIGADIDWDIDGRGNGANIRFINGRYVIGGHRCAVSESRRSCLRRLEREGLIGIDGSGEIVIDCATCGSRISSRGSGGTILQGIAEITGALAPPLFGYLGVRANARAFENSNVAWAGAAATGFEQCQIMQTSYVQNTYDYLSGNELPDRSVLPPECNGYQLNGFAGMGGLFGNGAGGFGNVWGGSGYSPQFMAAMYGPGGGFNPYLNVTGGYGIGNPYAGMGYNPYAGFGLQGNLNLNSLLGLPPNGISFNGGLNSGMYSGFPGGFNGGFNGGLNGGFTGMPGGFNGAAYSPITCFRAPCPGGGGFNVGFRPGWGNNATTAPWGGATAWGGVQYPNTGGGYWNGSGGYNNGSVNGNGWFQVQNAQSFNNQAFQAGSFNQQIALQNQAGQAAFNTQYGGGGNFGYAPFAPSNAGFSLSGGFGLGTGFGFNGF